MIITIGREYGSGGKYIGERLAEELNMKLYDSELIDRVSKERNIDINLLNENDEKHKNSFWYTLAMASMASYESINSLTELPSDDKYFIEESKVIEEIADEGNSIIIGRCSNVVLQNRKDVVNIFIYSSDEKFKIDRKVEFAGLDEKKALKLMHKKDKERATYYNYYTNKIWGARDSYDLLVDSSKLGIENTVKFIKDYIKYLEQKWTL